MQKYVKIETASTLHWKGFERFVLTTESALS